LKYGLPVECHVILSIYNILGEKVIELQNESISACYHSIIWNLSNFTSGLYIYKIIASPQNGDRSFTQVRKMISIK